MPVEQPARHRGTFAAGQEGRLGDQSGKHLQSHIEFAPDRVVVGGRDQVQRISRAEFRHAVAQHGLTEERRREQDSHLGRAQTHACRQERLHQAQTPLREARIPPGKLRECAGRGLEVIPGRGCHLLDSGTQAIVDRLVDPVPEPALGHDGSPAVVPAPADLQFQDVEVVDGRVQVLVATGNMLRHEFLQLSIAGLDHFTDGA
nr:hypothetical protein [uncultured Actinoplanes sp.]